MGDYFQVGTHYQNRIGEYEVVEVNTPTLVIKYVETGRLQTVEEELQERIVRNLERETALANKPEEERKPAAKKRPTRSKRAKFEGFVVGDFDGAVKGTSWRSKTGLGGYLAQGLMDRGGEAFDSWAPNRQTACYIGSPEEASAEALGDSAQFFVRTGPGGLTYGLSVHRPADAAEGATAWDRLVGSLTDDETIASQLTDLLTSGVVALSWYGESWADTDKETVRGDDGGLTLDRGSVTETDTLEAILERLNEVPQDQPLILTVECELSAQESIAGGAGLGDTILDQLEQLIGLYRACRG